ncbi:MAG TPA: hypothetical protein VHG28_08575 [Longimicrobiaceae bacterium]|nr:hypothetical protein [Longimicrobiaceae bacterium]
MADESLTLDSYGVREIAEYASGVRGEKVYLVATPDPALPGNYLITPSTVPVAPGPDQVVVPCNTAYIQPGRPKVTKVTVVFDLEHADGTEHRVTQDVSQYDALFWSESAVEKFLFPYYASKYQWAAAYWLDAISTHWYGFVPDPASGLPSMSQAAGRTTEGSDSFAMVHYPRSDYGYDDDIEPVLTPGADVHVLRVVTDAEGQSQPVATPLVELVRQPATAR